MLNQDMRDVIRRAKKYGWVLEPEAKRMLSLGRDSRARFPLGDHFARGPCRG